MSRVSRFFLVISSSPRVWFICLRFKRRSLNCFRKSVESVTWKSSVRIRNSNSWSSKSSRIVLMRNLLIWCWKIMTSRWATRSSLVWRWITLSWKGWLSSWLKIQRKGSVQQSRCVNVYKKTINVNFLKKVLKTFWNRFVIRTLSEGRERSCWSRFIKETITSKPVTGWREGKEIRVIIVMIDRL